MRKPVKISIIVGSILVLLILAFFITSYFVLQNSLPLHKGNIQISNLNKNVEITFDKMGIPQIWAENETDAYFAFGYLHASDRLFQMDMTRRVAQGRLSELLGPAVLDVDVHQRTVGHYRIAEKYLNKLSQQNKARLTAYSAGVNYYKNNCKALPFEYQLLGTDFEDWTIFDCLTVMSFQTWFSDYLMSPDAFLTEAVDKLGYDKVKSLDIPYPVWAPYCSPQEDEQNNQAAANTSVKEELVEQLFSNIDLPFRMSNSSNSWVIAPHKSASGKAMLASDPHLEVTRLPQFWYQIGLHIESENIHSLGISTPGLPFITMGHNSHAAYAFTVSGVDVNEYYEEKFNPEDSTQYLTPDGWQNVEVFKQQVKISGKDESLEFDVKTTRHGPIVFKNDSLKKYYSLHWAGFDVDLDKCFSAGFNLYKVDNFADFQKTVTAFGALDANWTYADINGNIGYQLGTPVAIRPLKQDNLPKHGWEDTFEWQGFYPLEKTPHSYNPPRGWLATCNNKQDQAGLDYPLYGFYANDRIMRIGQLLNSKEIFTIQDMYDFQMDTKDVYLLRWKEILIQALNKLNTSDDILQIQNWDGSADKNSKEAALMILFLTRLHHLTFDDEFDNLSPKIAVSDLEHIWYNGPQEWFDDISTPDKIESKEELAVQAAKEALEIRADKSWGDFQSLTMSHPLAVVPLVSDMLNLEYGPYRWDGTAGTLKASFNFEDKKNPNHFISTVGPSWRFVIDFADINAATYVLPAGNSGNPVSPHFMDFFDMWYSGERWNIPVNKELVKPKTITKLSFSAQ